MLVNDGRLVDECDAEGIALGEGEARAAVGSEQPEYSGGFTVDRECALDDTEHFGGAFGRGHGRRAALRPAVRRLSRSSRRQLQARSGA